MPKSKDLGSLNCSGSNFDSEVDKKLKSRKQVATGKNCKEAKDW